MKRARSAEVILGTGALIAGIAVFGFVVVRSVSSSVTTEGALAAADPALQVDEIDRGVPFELPPEYVRRAVDAAPFEPDRAPPSDRYRLPGEEFVLEMPMEMPEPEIPPPPAFQVLGTAASADGGLAIVRIDNGTPQLLSLGDQMSGYRVESIDRGQVVMANQDRSLSLAVASPTPSAPSAEEAPRRGRQNQRGNDDDDRRQARTQEVAGVQMMQAAQALAGRLQNASPEQRAALIEQFQQMQQRLGQQGTTVRIEGDRVLMGPVGPGAAEDRAGGQRNVVVETPTYRFSVPAQPR